MLSQVAVTVVHADAQAEAQWVRPRNGIARVIILAHSLL